MLLAGVFCFALGSRGQIQTVLTLVQSIQLPQANIWGGISYNGENISITTTFTQNRPQLYLRKLDKNLGSDGAIIQLTFDSDPESAKHITDHKHLFLNGYHFVTFSVAGDSDLYILKTDREGRRIGTIVPVVENTVNRTNDMMFCSDGEMLYVGYFKPTAQSVIHILDQNLRQVQPPLETSLQLPHNNLGGMTYRNGKFYMFTGDKAGPNSNLILTVWNHDWSPAEAQRRILIPAPSGGGYFFATGIAYDDAARRWYLGFHHVQNENPDGTTHLDLAVFDEKFNLVEHQHTVAGFRPHFLLLDGFLYSVYDRGGVFLNRFQVSASPVAPGSTLFFSSITRNESLTSGLAVVNPADVPAHLKLSAFDNKGALVNVSGGANPVDLVLPARGQIARLIWQLFGQNFSTEGCWVRLASDLSNTTGFHLRFDSKLQTMDGAGSTIQLLSYFVFPVLENAEISLVNPDNVETAAVGMRWINAEGVQQGDTKTIQIASRGRFAGRIRDLSPPGPKDSECYLSIASSAGLAAMEWFGSPGKFESALNALDANGGARNLIAPQFVSDATYRTSVTVVNLENAPTNLLISLMDDHGQVTGREASVPLAPRGWVVIGTSALFATSPAGGLQGYLKVASRATRITGVVQFGDLANDRFHTALPLVAEGFEEALYSQVAEDSTYFTGFAVVNPNAQATGVTVAAYSPAGELLRSGTETLEGSGRLSRLLREFLPTMTTMSGGYFTLSTSLPTMSFAVFGTQDLSALSAIPALPLAKSNLVGAAPAERYLKANSDSDFGPPRGGVANGPGPAMNRLMVAKSSDGLTFARTNKIVTDQGAVPDMVVDESGTIYLYYTGWTVGTEINKTVVAVSRDKGESWTFKKLNLWRNEGESDLVDPDVLILDDGTFRLYTTIGEQGKYARTHYADSLNGIIFERKGVAFDPGSQALDPSAIKIGKTYHLFAGGMGNPEANWHGTSPDGAVYQFDKVMTFKFNGFGQMMANGLRVDGGYRFYSFGNDRKGGVSSFFTKDGETWAADEGYRLMVDPGSTLEDGPPTDPAVARLSDGSYLMVCSCRINTSK